MANFADSGLNLQLKNFDPFKDGLNQINKQVKDLNSNLLEIQKTYSSLSQSIGKATKSLTTMGNRITKSETSLGKLSDRLMRQNELMLRGNRRAGSLGDSFDILQTRTEKYSNDIRELSTQLLDSNNRLRNFQNTATRPGLDNLTDRVDRANRELAETPRVAQQASSKLKFLGDVAKGAASSFGNFARGGLALATKGVAAFGVGASLAVGATSKAAIDFQTSFTTLSKTVDGLSFVNAETGMISLTKQGEEIKETFLDLSTEIPVTANRLSELGSLGGQFGLDVDSIEEFTKTVAILGETTNISAEEAGTGLARISGLFSDELDDLGINEGENIAKLGNVIVELGNTMKVNENEILNYATRLSGVGATVGLVQSDLFAIGASFAETGISAEAGATAVNNALLTLNEALVTGSQGTIDNTKQIENYRQKLQSLNADLVQTESGQHGLGMTLVDQEKAFIEAGNKAEDFGRLLGDKTRESAFKTQKEIIALRNELVKLEKQQGQPIQNKNLTTLLGVVQKTEKGARLTAESFSELWQKDASEAFSLFVEGLALEGDNASRILDELGLGSSESQRAFLAIAQSADTLSESFQISADQFESGNAALEEAEQRFATTESLITKFKNSINVAAIRIGDSFLPAIGNLLQQLTPIADIIGTRIPDVLTALGTKFGPVFDELGLNLEGVDFTAILDNGFDLLIGAIDSFDTTILTDSLTTLTDDIFPVINTGISFLVENWDLLSGTLLTAATVGGGIWAATAAIGTLTAAVTFLVSPIGIAIAAVTALGVAWETNFLGIQETTDSFIEGFKEGGFSGAFEGIGIPPEVIESGQDFIDGFIQPIKDTIPTIKDSFSSISESITNLLDSPAFDFINQGSGDFGTFFTENSEHIGEFLGVVIATPIDQVAGIIEILSSFLDLLASPDTESITALTDSILDFLAIPFDNFGSLFTGDPDFSVLETIDTTFTEFADEWLTGFDDLLSLADLGMPTWDFITVDEDLEAAWTQWSGAFDNLLTAVDLGQPIYDDTVTTVADSIETQTGIWAGIVDNALGIIDLGMPTFDDTDTTLTDTLTTLQTNVETALAGFEGIISDIALGELNLPEIDLDLTQLSGLKDSISEALTGLSGIIGDIDLGAIELPGGFDLTAIEGLQEQITTALDGLSDILGGIDLGEITIPEIELDLTEVGTNLKTSFENTFGGILDDIVLGSPQFDILALGAEAANLVTGIQDAFTSILDETDMGIPTIGGGLGFAVALSDATTGIKNAFSGLLTGTDLGLPTFPDLLTKAKELGQSIVDYFSGLLTGLDLGLPTLPEFITDIDLTPDFIFGGEDEATQSGQDLGQAQQEGIAKGIEDNQEEPKSAIETASQFMSDTWDSWWESESPSKVTELKGQEIMAGWALGLSDTTAVIAAVNTFNELLLTAFEQLSQQVMGASLPSMQLFQLELENLYQGVIPLAAETIDEFSFTTLTELINTFNTLNFETIPAYVSIILDQAIPATNDMGSAVKSLSSDIRTLTTDIGALAGVLGGQLVGAIKKSTEQLKKTRVEGKALDSVIKRLTKRYLALAAAITAAANAGSGLSQPAGTPVGLAKGGSFIVPGQSSIPDNLKTKDGGMIITVHPGELVNVTPASETKQSMRVPMENFIRPTANVQAPGISGAGIANNITNTTDNSTKGDTFVLNVANPVESSSVISSFRLMETLARA